MTGPSVDPALVDLTAKSLATAADGDLAGAVEFADRAADAGSLLGVALSTYLRTSQRPDVYDQPAAFEAFITGGGNVDLYRKTSAALAAAYRGVSSLLDIGCGNGLALVPALQLAGDSAPATVELVEPGADLLRHCVATIQQSGVPAAVTGWQMGLTDFLAAAPAGQRWNLVQSTFALQSVEPTERLTALRALALRVDRIVIVDFDVPGEKPGGRKHLRGLAERYERGLAEYDETRDLVAQGFLMPVLLGQLSATVPRTNWEHPAEQWRAELEAAGFQDIELHPLADYWSAPAFLLTAIGAQEPAQEQDGEPWDSGDRMTPADWGRQETLGKVHEDLRRISDAEPGYGKGPYISGSIDLAQNSLAFWWFGPLPVDAQAVIDEARAEGITVAALEAPFSRADLDSVSRRILDGTQQWDIGLSMVMHNHDGSGFTVHFRTEAQAAAAAQAVGRIATAAAEGREPAAADQPFRSLYAPVPPSITIDPGPRDPQDW